MFDNVSPGPVEITLGSGKASTFHVMVPEHDLDLRFEKIGTSGWKPRWAGASAGVVALGGAGIAADLGGKPIQIASTVVLAGGIALLFGVAAIDAFPTLRLIPHFDSHDGHRLYLAHDRSSASHAHQATVITGNEERSCALPCELRGVPAGPAKLLVDSADAIDFPVGGEETIDIPDGDAAFDVGYRGRSAPIPSAVGVTAAAMAIGGLAAVIVGAAAPDTTAPLERIGGAACALGFGAAAVYILATPSPLRITPSVVPNPAGTTVGFSGMF